MPENITEALQKKEQLRQSVIAIREKQEDADLSSRRIWGKLLELPRFARARTVMTYLDFGGEVRTREHLPELWRLGKKVVVPYCMGHELKLFHLKNMDELAPGMWMILEPRPEWRDRPDRQVEASALDLIIVPGLAFDRNGDRLGFGKGYYDHFLQHVRADALKIALAFECQMVEKIPVLAHDVRMDMVITESAIYQAD